MFLLPISVLCLHKLSSPKEGIPREVGLVQGHVAVWGRGEGWQPTLGVGSKRRIQVCRRPPHNPTAARKQDITHLAKDCAFNRFL